MKTDTERLDWLDKYGGNISSTTRLGEVPVFNVCAYALTEWTSDFTNVREAIDAAMDILSKEPK